MKTNTQASIAPESASQNDQAEKGADNGATPPEKDPNTVVLDTPIVRGKQTISEITLRKPRSGELRGVSLQDLVNLDVIALSKVLPRISSPTLTEHDVAQLDPADLVQLGGVFAGFLWPKAVKASMESLNG
ncbi:phage tail assembly protein [Paraburkholderia bannensis]|nr:phage tail assembly protein [Paraburkholderia bannensis]RQM46516.1 phage tail assembly protein [Paraburkholderia bannensis]